MIYCNLELNMSGKDFLERVDQLLLKNNLNRNELSQRAGIKKDTMYGFWKYDRIPRADDAAKIGNVLGVSVEYLLTGKDLPRKQINPVKKELINFIEDQNDENFLKEILGALKTLQYLRLTKDSLNR